MAKLGPVYVYGIGHRDAPLPPDALGAGIGDSPVELIAGDGLIALASHPRHVPVPSSRRNLLAHTAVLERLIPFAPLLPVRFGTVAPSQQTLSRCLNANQQVFAASLREIDGMVEFGLKASWKSSAVYDDIINDSPRLRALRDRMRQNPASDTYRDRIELGRQVEAGLAERRAAEARAIVAALQPLAARAVELKLLNDEMVLNRAFLVPRMAEGEFDAAVDALGERLGDRMAFRYVGPVPPYNFVSVRADWLTGRAA